MLYYAIQKHGMLALVCAGKHAGPGQGAAKQRGGAGRQSAVPSASRDRRPDRAPRRSALPCQSAGGHALSSLESLSEAYLLQHLSVSAAWHEFSLHIFHMQNATLLEAYKAGIPSQARAGHAPGPPRWCMRRNNPWAVERRGCCQGRRPVLRQCR